LKVVCSAIIAKPASSAIPDQAAIRGTGSTALDVSGVGATLVARPSSRAKTNAAARLRPAIVQTTPSRPSSGINQNPPASAPAKAPSVFAP
jgi:hypothetical protein